MYVTVEHITSITSKQLSKRLNKIIKLYGRGNFGICVILTDMEFEKVAEILGNVEVSIASSREHVGDVERRIRIAKERGREIYNTLTYSYLPSNIIIHLVYFIVMWSNTLTYEKWIYQKYSPR